MPSWKKVIVSGSDASLNSLIVPSITGSLEGTSSFAITSSYAINAATASISNATTLTQLLVINQTGTTINKGIVVRISGSNNASDIPRIATASYEDDSVSANTLGIVSANITNGSQGYVITEGVLTGISTTGWSSGTLIFLGPTGSIIASAPQAPLHAVRLGQVIREQNNNGSISVRVDNGYELNELHDVDDNTTTASYGDLLVKSGSVWTNSRQLTGSYALTGSLTVTGSTTTDLVRITQTGTGNAFVVEDSANPDSSPFTITNAGNVGIGTTSPSQKLDIVGDGQVITRLRSNETGSAYYLTEVNSNNTAIALGKSGAIIGTGTSNILWSSTDLQFYVSSLERARITSAGNVGIGVTIPTSQLHVSGTIQSEILTNGDNFITLLARDARVHYIKRFAGNPQRLQFTSDAPGTSYDVQFDASNSSVYILTGSVGIGTTSAASASLVVNSSGFGSDTYIAQFQGGGIQRFNFTSDGRMYWGLSAIPSNANGYVSWDTGKAILGAAGNTNNLSFVAGTIERMFISSSGNIGIGKDSPNAKLDVNGDTIISGSLTTTSSVIFKGYSSVSSFPGTAEGYLAFNSSGNIITVAAGNPFPFTGSAQITGSLSVTGSLNIPLSSSILLQTNASTSNGKIHISEFPNPSGSLNTSSTIYNYGAGSKGLILQYGFDEGDVGGIKITDDGVAVFGSGDDDLFKVVNEDGDIFGQNIQAFAINNTNQVGINKPGVIDVTTPINATLDVNGNTIITGSLTVTAGITGTASFASSAATASFITPLNQNVLVTGSLNVTSNITGSGLLITGSTSGNLVRITQTGAGNAFVVEDSANPDSTLFVIDTSGSVGIGSPVTPSIFSSKLYVGTPEISGWAGIKSNGNNNHAIIGYGSSGYAGIYGENNETSGNNNIGVYGKAYQDGDPFNGVLMIGGKFEAAGDPQYAINYSVQLKDGTQGIGKVLVCQDASGSANWSTQLSGSYEITGSLTVTDKIKGTSSHIDTNALIQASLLYLSNNF